ncbi:hypothetical protein [Sphingomonas qomolangmaensis]|uniref:Uncharacterized protein n=1 Tax=Sphingomonas qomolangmaensis TaxID=2918765 RepID=A0ABY5LD37_9SPHN|nr:hypothetical protein [Sphingomonas qomolangmaensis]UUL84021.1 hypothetical protein NMP03_07490 [Sphingomonas qomolangmaensis]
MNDENIERSGEDPAPDTPGSGRRAWFIYSVIPGRFSAAPASIEGWLVLLGLPAINLLFLLGMRSLLGSDSVLLLVIGLLSLAATLVTIFTIARIRGRPHR